MAWPVARSRLGRAACLGLALAALAACREGNPVCAGDDLDVVRPEGWTVASHCAEAEPNYAEVFGDDAVHVVDLVMSAQDHAAALADMDELIANNTSADLDGLARPMWIPVTVKYERKTWSKVAMRYKGHASLKAAWTRGVRKLSFALDFDHFADDEPDLANQRFHGFSRLAFSNGYQDSSLLHDKLAAEIFRDNGVPATRSAFAAVYLDWGEGRVYAGLHTIIEDPADTMLRAQFGDASGNLYKPWGRPARWLSPSQFEQEGLSVRDYFEKSTNEGAADWSDVEAAVEALHADRSNAAAWRAGLEERFDVASFLRTLAVSQAMVSWDSYGCMNHNYFLYADPSRDGRLVWFPWDLNEALAEPRDGWPTRCAHSSVLLDEIAFPTEGSGIDTQWPLIERLLGDPVYRAVYRADLQALLDGGGFAVDALKDRVETYHALIAPYVVGPTEVEKYPYRNCTADEFNASKDALEEHLAGRPSVVASDLAADTR